MDSVPSRTTLRLTRCYPGQRWDWLGAVQDNAKIYSVLSRKALRLIRCCPGQCWDCLVAIWDSAEISWCFPGQCWDWLGTIQDSAEIDSELSRTGLRFTWCYPGQGWDWLGAIQDSAEIDSDWLSVTHTCLSFSICFTFFTQLYYASRTYLHIFFKLALFTKLSLSFEPETLGSLFEKAKI